MRKTLYFILCGLMLAAVPTKAQVVDDVVPDDEVPFGLQEAEEGEFDDYFESNFLSPLDEDVELEDKNPFFNDEYYAERLKAIPGPEEFHVYNSTVRSYIDRYAVRMRRSVAVMLGKYNLYGNIFDDILDRYDLPEVLRFLPVIESGLNPTAKSHAGAGGLWQFMPSTAKGYGLDINSWVDERNDPYLSTDAAARLLKKEYDRFGDWSLVLAAYNCGAGNVNKAIARAGGVKDFWAIYPYLPKETRGYVPAFIAASYIMNNYSQHNIKPRQAIKAIEVDTAVVHYDMRMEQIAKACGISVEEIKSFNPQYKTSFIPGGRRRSTIALPLDLAVRFAGIEDSIHIGTLSSAPEYVIASDTVETEDVAGVTEDVAPVQQPRTAVRSSSSRSNSNASNHKSSSNNSKKGSNSKKKGSKSGSRSREVTVQKGDNLSKIAKRNNTTVAELKRKNKIKGDRIRAGQKIKVK